MKKTIVLIGALSALVLASVLLDTHDEPVSEFLSFSTCLGRVETKELMEDWHEFKINRDVVVIKYTTRVRGGLMRRTAKCSKDELLSIH